VSQRETVDRPKHHDDGIRSVAVIGAGTMGSGIAQIVAEAHVPVTMIDVAAPAVERGQRTIDDNWQRAIAKGRFDEGRADTARQHLSVSTAYDAVATADLVIEAIVEDLEAKRRLFSDVSVQLRHDAVLASNTSSISITQLAAATDRPDRVIGMHFFNPVPVMTLVEVVRGLLTSDATFGRVQSFAVRLGKTPVEVNDFPGFVSNRVLMPMINEAVFCLGEGVASTEAIDQVMKLGMAHPMGPLALADLIGLDVCLDILTTLQRDLGEDKYRPAPLLRRMVAAGKLGRKSGEGFYRY